MNQQTTTADTSAISGDDDKADARRYRGVIGRIRPAATYELVVDQVKRAIFLGRFMPGDKLPAERDLAEQLQVSRTTIREAMRMLEGEGLILVKRGSTGGLVVKGPIGLQPQEIETYVQAQQGLLNSIFEFRIANECMAARLAAIRRSEAQLERLEMALTAMGELCETPELRAITANIARFRSLDSEFHLVVAEAADNPFIMQAVEDGRTEMFLPIGKVFTRLEDSANEHHEEIFTAIKASDPDRAARAMEHHIKVNHESLDDLMPKGRRKRG